jgi:hypothetical protein
MSNRMGTCARKWKRGETEGASYRTHMKKCMKGGGSTSTQTRATRSSLGGSTCARQCNQKIKNRIAAGDRTPKATMRRVCLRKCTESRVTASLAPAAKAEVKRDVNKLCSRYCSGGNHSADCKSKCASGEIGPGRLVMQLASRTAPPSFVRDAAYRKAKHEGKFKRKRRGMIRSAARLGSHRSTGVRSPFGGTGRKTIGRRRR